MSTRLPLRIAIDSGGTFTDCVWLPPPLAAPLQDSTLQILKVFSTPADPAQAIADAVKKIAGDAQEIVVLHGTTVGTNTLLQRKGARVAFVTTKGFEDSIEIGRQQRPKLYDFFFEKDPALSPAELRFGVDERTSAEGTMLRAPTAAVVADACRADRRAKAAGHRALSIVFFCQSRKMKRPWSPRWPRSIFRSLSLTRSCRSFASMNAPARCW